MKHFNGYVAGYKKSANAFWQKMVGKGYIHDEVIDCYKCDGKGRTPNGKMRPNGTCPSKTCTLCKGSTKTLGGVQHGEAAPKKNQKKKKE